MGFLWVDCERCSRGEQEREQLAENDGGGGWVDGSIRMGGR